MLEALRSLPRSAKPDSRLWRIMDFTKYVSMLHRRALFFSRADQLPDPFEGMRARRNLEAGGSMESAKRLRQKVFLSCWHENDHESAAMWRIYLSNDEGVAIKSSVGRLEQCLSEAPVRLHFGAVRYVDYRAEQVDDPHELAPFFCKRKNFDFEREMRALWHCDEPPASGELGRYLEVNLEHLIDCVVVSPTAERWFGELVESVTAKYGLRLRVTPSSMLDPES